jgi:beta-galactosidase
VPTDKLPAFPYGAVYFRKSNPPREDWERDYQTAAEDGMNTFRHWFMWSAIEVAPGECDWEEYDRQLDLAAANGMKTIIAEFVAAAPEWAFVEYAHARYVDAHGQPVNSGMGGSSSTGGFPGLCLDNDDWRERAGGFLTALATRYKGHPGLGGYDIWNEITASHNFCFCQGTQAKFREWLKARYNGDLKALGRAWGRYSFGSWDNVAPPRSHGVYGDTHDWLQFRVDNAFELMRWRRDTIRSVDPDCVMAAHGVGRTFGYMPSLSSDDWRGAQEVEVYGVTWGSSRHGDQPWRQMYGFDLIRAASRGKPFWHAEQYGGPLWLQGQVVGRPRDDGRIPTPDDIRYWSMVSFMGGATGMMYLRWRPLLNGALFGAFGPYDLDGSRTPRSEMASRVGKWAGAAEQRALWRSRPVKGEIGIVYVPETQMFVYAQQQTAGRAAPGYGGAGGSGYWDSPHAYSQSMEGAYRAFWASNVQADFVHVDDIDQYDRLYLPIPIMLSRATADRLRAWVERGGTLISEGCPAYWGDGWWVGQQQPNFGLDELFGARQADVEFTPDLLKDLRLTVRDTPLWGGVFMQSYEPTTGTAAGHYEDGRVAAVEHRFGKGRTLLIGTMPGAGHFFHADGAKEQGGQPLSAAFFAGLLRLGERATPQHVAVSDPRIKARLHAGEGGVSLWVANPTREAVPVRLTLAETWGPYASARSVWGGDATSSGQTVELTAPARDVTVLALQ